MQYSLDTILNHKNLISDITNYVEEAIKSDEPVTSAETIVATRNLTVEIVLKAYIDYMFYKNHDFTETRNTVQRILHILNENQLIDVHTIWNNLFLYMKQLYNQRVNTFKRHLFRQIEKNIKPSLSSITIDKDTFNETLKEVLNLIGKSKKNHILQDIEMN